jgi:hypothetical protein
MFNTQVQECPPGPDALTDRPEQKRNPVPGVILQGNRRRSASAHRPSA